MSDEDSDLSLDLAAVKQRVSELAVLERQIKALGTRQKEVKDLLRALVEIEGESDEKGHQVFDLGEQVEGIGALIRQRRVSRSLDGDAARQILESIVTDEDFGRTLWNDCVEMVPVLDEDKVMAAFYDGVLTEEQIDEMYTINETWAFVTRG